jgi:hypothetical protein
MATQFAQRQSWQGIRFRPRRLANGNFFVRHVCWGSLYAFRAA